MSGALIIVMRAPFVGGEIMACRVEDVIRLVEEIAPPDLAEEWDNVGLLVGSRRAEISRVLVSLDCTREVLEEARKSGAGLLVCHHPPVFRPLRRLLLDEPEGHLLCAAVRAGMSLYAAHTNLDVCEEGVNAALAEALGLVGHRPLPGAKARSRCKLVTFLPPEHVAAVSAALFAAGAGRIGDYTGCSFLLEGTGTFTPGPDSHPAYGEAEGPNQVRETRLEVVVEEERLEDAVRALLAGHPYEEPAYDVYPLRAFPAAGMGRVGELPAPETLSALARRCSRELGNPSVRIAGDPAAEVRRVAVCGGSGGKLASAALAAGAQVLVTGDVGYHEAQEAVARDLAIIDAGHYHTEIPAVARLARLLEEKAEKTGLEVSVLASSVRACPWSHGGGE